MMAGKHLLLCLTGFTGNGSREIESLKSPTFGFMPKKQKYLLEAFLLLTLASACIFLRFGDVYFQFGSQKVVMAWGDGLKTYTNTIFHIRHDSTYSYFEGMNYPYSEHIMAATELPGLAIALRFIHRNITELSDAQVVDIIHLTLMLSLLLCALFLWLILKKLRLPFWYSIPIAIALTFLAPQTQRLNGHFGLAMVFVIPMVFYLLLRFEEKKQWKWAIWIAFALFISAQFHFYFFGILAGVVFLYLIFGALKVGGNLMFSPILNGWKRTRHLLLMLLPPLLCYYFWMVAGDPVTDRSPNPSGFLQYKATLESIFTNFQLPVFQWIDEHLFEINKAEFEGRAYVGVVAGLFCIVWVLRWIWSMLEQFLNTQTHKPQPTTEFSVHSSYLSTILITSIMLALFACGIPFIIPKMEFLLDYAGPLRQFRSIGRFAWVFYFGINIYAFTQLFNWLNEVKFPPNLIKLPLALIISLLCYDAFEFSHSRTYKLYDGHRFKKGEAYTTIKEVDFSKYQAILPIPYFNIGSNNFAKNEEGFSSHASFIMSAQTGLPNIAAMLTRTSRIQTFKQWQLLGKPFIIPRVFEDYPSEKPILMIWWKKIKAAEAKRYGHLKERAKFLYEEGNMELYEIPLGAFSASISDRIIEVDNALKNDMLFEHGDFLSTDSLKNFVFLDFDNPGNDKPSNENKRFVGITTDMNIIFDQKLPNLRPGKPYEISLWVNFGTDRFGMSLAGLLQEIAPSGEKLQEKKWYLGRQILTCAEPCWGLSTNTFKPKAADSHFRFIVTWNLRDSESFHIDDLLIRPLDTDLYKNDSIMIWKNNW